MTDLISVDEALRCLADNMPARTVQQRPLLEAMGAVLAEPVIAKLSRPPAAVSAMDGYAVRLEDVKQAGAKLTVIGEAPAGRSFPSLLQAGQAVRIFTGGELPRGSDHIVIQEVTDRQADSVMCRLAYEDAEYVRPAGLDFTEGDVLIETGTRLGAAELAIAAAANHASLTVFKPLRVGLLANGNELKPPGSELAAGEIVNSNPYGLAPLIESWGGTPAGLGIAEDSVVSIQNCIRSAEDIDIFVPIGGASVGDHDHMRKTFAGLGFDPVFEKLAVRPGKPTWFSRNGKQLVLGLPGNPASALVCAQLFLAPLLGRDWTERMVQVRLSTPLKLNGPREHFLRAIVEMAPDGCLSARVSHNQDSSLLRPFLEANALLRRAPNAPALGEGASVEIIPLKPLLG